MTKLLSAVLVALLWSTGAPASASAQVEDKAAAEKALIENERKLNEAVAKGDRETFRTLIADDGLWARTDGFVPVTLFVEAFDQMKVTSPDIVNPLVLWVHPSTAIVVSVWTGSGTVMNQPFTPKLAATVWTTRGDRWVAVYHHESDAPRQ